MLDAVRDCSVDEGFGLVFFGFAEVGDGEDAIDVLAKLFEDREGLCGVSLDNRDVLAGKLGGCGEEGFPVRA